MRERSVWGRWRVRVSLNGGGPWRSRKIMEIVDVGRGVTDIFKVSGI